MARRVDHAMAGDRPEKRAIRALWMEEAEELHGLYPDVDSPLYLTLSGSEGRDIELLVERGLLRRTEVGSVASEDGNRVVAVESSPSAVLELQRKFPGLKILEVRFADLVRSENPLRWPEGQDERYCRALVVNLDLNQSLDVIVAEDELRFPVLTWISKLAQIHARPPRREWSLLLTLHGEIGWHPAISQAVQELLAENFVREPEFEAACRTLFGPEIQEQITQSHDLDLAALPRPMQQRMLMAFVPKKISQLVCPQGWAMSTRRNLRYGGRRGRASMVSWVIRLRWDARVARTPDAVYRESLRRVLEGEGSIDEDGNIS